ncbi:MAG: NAD(P)H-dependent oxidoreductase [Actinomycetota bacterium]
MNVLGIPASNSRDGLNRQIVGYAARLLEGGELGVTATVDILDLNEFEMPIYSTERQHADGFPEPAVRFRDRVAWADALILSFAEHNGSYSVAWKNVFDWVSRIDLGVYQGRTIAMFSTAPGPRGGAGVLEHAVLVAPFFAGEVVGSLVVPRFGENFDRENGELSNPELRDEFGRIVAALVGAEASMTPGRANP